MKASDLMTQCLEHENVEYIFGLPGEENLELMESLSSSKIKFMIMRHEQGAAFAADLYGRIKQKPGVCLSTLGPGALNLATGVASANLDHSPLVAITGQAEFRQSHRELHQYVDIVSAFKPITKWNARIASGESAPEIVRKAFYIAKKEKQGATHIELPNDIAGEQANGQPLDIPDENNTNPVDSLITSAAKIINEAKYPIILAGNGLIRTNTCNALLSFAEATNIPVAKTFMSKGSIPSGHKLSLGTIGLQSKDYLLCEFDRADVVITIGYDLVEYAPTHWNAEKNKRIINIDTASAEFIDSHYAFEQQLIGDLAYILEKLGMIVKKRTAREQSKKLEQLKQTIYGGDNFSEKYPLKPQYILHVLRDALAKDDILISDVGAHKLWIARLFPTYVPNTVIISNGFASMGIALPGAIGAKLAAPEKRVVAVSGDGGFLMNMQELETAKRLALPFVNVIVNDNGYGAIEWSQQRSGKKTFGVKFGNPDFVKLAESFGAKGYRIERASEFEEILKNAIKNEELAVIDVPVDYSENMVLTKKLGPNICQVF